MDRSSPAVSFPCPDDNNDNVDITRQAEEDQRDCDAFNAWDRACQKGRFAGLILGIGLAIRLRRGQTRLFKAMRVGERPVAVVLPDGKAGEF